MVVVVVVVVAIRCHSVAGCGVIGPCTQGRTPLPPPPPPYWTKITLGLTCDDFTLSLGPLEANIYVFSGGLSEND